MGRLILCPRLATTFCYAGVVSKNVDYRRHEYARNNEHLDPWKIIARWSLPENVVWAKSSMLSMLIPTVK